MTTQDLILHNSDLLDTEDKKRLFALNYDTHPNNARAYLFKLICEAGNKENHRETIEKRLTMRDWR
jgi:hypothetical protein